MQYKLPFIMLLSTVFLRFAISTLQNTGLFGGTLLPHVPLKKPPGFPVRDTDLKPETLKLEADSVESLTYN